MPTWLIIVAAITAAIGVVSLIVHPIIFSGERSEEKLISFHAKMMDRVKRNGQPL